MLFTNYLGNLAWADLIAENGLSSSEALGWTLFAVFFIPSIVLLPLWLDRKILRRWQRPWQRPRTQG